jgi:hypothetical protein
MPKRKKIITDPSCKYCGTKEDLVPNKSAPSGYQCVCRSCKRKRIRETQAAKRANKVTNSPFDIVDIHKVTCFNGCKGWAVDVTVPKGAKPPRKYCANCLNKDSQLSGRSAAMGH